MKDKVLFAAFVVCAFISCTKAIENVKENNELIKQEETTPTSGMRMVTITASIEDATKTSYAVDGTFSWTAGDKISIIGNDNNPYTFTANGSGTSTTFTGTIPDGVLGDRAYFPADAGHTPTKFSLPYSKDVTGHDSADIPMVGTKGEGNAYEFKHCAGAALLTIENFPNDVISATITIASTHGTDPAYNYKLSGLFTIQDGPKWDGAYATETNDNIYSRKVSVSGNTAKLYIPCPAGANNWVPNKLTVVGHTSSSDVPIFTNKNMKKLGTVNRAHVMPLTPLVIYSEPDFSAVSPTAGGATHNQIAELKAYADKGYLHMRFHGATASWTGTKLNIYIYDGGNDSDPDAPYKEWSIKKTAHEIHASSIAISTSSLGAITMGGANCIASVTSSGDQTYWTISIPRTASSAMMASSGTVYLGVMVQDDTWACTAAVPEIWVNADMVEVTIP